MPPDPRDRVIPLAAQRRRRWAAALIGRGRATGVTCAYGDDTWHRLPQDHPARIAAVIVAAEAHAQAGDHLAEQLAVELQAARKAAEQTDAEAFAEMAATIRRQAMRPTVGELAHRRGDITTEQLVEWEAANRQFIAGRTDEPPRLPTRGGVA